MTIQPKLEGDTIRLRPLTEADRAALANAARDPAIWEQHPDPKRYTDEGFSRYFENALASGGALVIEERDTGRIIGSSRYHALDGDAGRIEIGWTFLIRDHWGGATNREVKTLMLTHAFELVPTVVFRIGAGNRRSRRAIEKIGGRLVDQQVSPDGLGTLIYELDRHGFDANL